ncbi:P2Y purinoceptor 14-like isoform X2 [Carcharodon carcharias]|uniref:P2Y purinoceptor 14-like isoform X2 n=1 Tax=Carcharodon carcharias TaxID=13397 RepID=UPI001B7E2FB8|nr:P2Y purinoceptor 14-like isoform X2 [Carcharodon carcharias]XP_041066779.1 P2Y purinoceptor 14-like isoform X2 [Carcharodon carcharias]XP_041066780.1 P2Y purinoceptor 14-like isoform X2 [Carcharodon carcharias]XP_041066781.1 P2Y purinoceptor 14-like isoform X2 [Carcharodon carcharias]
MNATKMLMESQCTLVADSIQRHIVGGLYTIIFLIGVISNIATIWAFKQADNSATFIYMKNLTASDLLLSCSLLFRAIYYLKSDSWGRKDFACILTSFVTISVFYVNMYCSILFLLWTSISRYAIVARPRFVLLCYFIKPKVIILVCVFTWIVPAMCILPLLLSYFAVSSMVTAESCYDLIINKTGRFFKNPHILGAAFFFLTLLLLIVFYMMLAYHLHQIKKNSMVAKSQASNLKVHRKFFASIILFIVCFVPYHVQRVIIVASEDVNCQWQEKLNNVKSGVILLAALSCCIHPLLHLCFLSKFCKSKCTQRKISYTDNTNGQTRLQKTKLGCE